MASEASRDACIVLPMLWNPDAANPIASAPLGATLPGFVERKPSGIPAATAASGHGALVSSSFPSRLSLRGYPAPPAKSLWALPHLCNSIHVLPSFATEAGWLVFPNQKLREV